MKKAVVALISSQFACFSIRSKLSVCKCWTVNDSRTKRSAWLFVFHLEIINCNETEKKTTLFLSIQSFECTIIQESDMHNFFRFYSRIDWYIIIASLFQIESLQHSLVIEGASL